MSFGEIPPVVHRSEALEEHFVPGELVSREAQIEEIRLALTPGPRKGGGQVWVSGPPGAGKTTTVRYVLERLRSELAVPVAYVNCWNANTSYLVLEKAYDELRILPYNGRKDALFRLEKLAATAAEKPLALVLDEFDLLSDRDRQFLLYTLAEMPHTSVVCIAGSLEPLAMADDRVLSRFRPVRVEFARYTQQDVLTILKARTEMGLTPGSYSQDQLQRIAELAGGDARIAIQTLRRAANLSDRKGSAFLTEEAIQAAYGDMREVRKQYALKQLSPHHRLAYDLITAQKGITAKELWHMYLRSARSYGLQPVALRTFRKHVNLDLPKARLVEARNAGNHRGVFRYFPL